MSSVSAQVPPGARRTLLDVPGGPLAAFETTPADPRGTALLVPGFSGSKEDFGPLLPLLTGWRLVALDQRGQHESAGPQDPAAYTIEALAGDVLAVVDRTGAPVQLVGHSFGGLVARRAALLRPSAFSGLTLMGSGPAGLTGPRVDVLAFLPGVLAEGGMRAVADAAEALDAADPTALPLEPEVRAFLRQRWLTSSGPGLVAMGHALQTEPDRVEALRATGVPVLVLHGADDDAWSPTLQRDMAERLGAVYRVVQGARHSPAAEAPDATAEALLTFWAS